MPQGRAETSGLVVLSGESHCGAPEAKGFWIWTLELASSGPLVFVGVRGDCDEKAGAGLEDGKEGRDTDAAPQLAAQRRCCVWNGGRERFLSETITLTGFKRGQTATASFRRC